MNAFIDNVPFILLDALGEVKRIWLDENSRRGFCSEYGLR
jgi:hypothetical protein